MSDSPISYVLAGSRLIKKTHGLKLAIISELSFPITITRIYFPQGDATYSEAPVVDEELDIYIADRDALITWLNDTFRSMFTPSLYDTFRVSTREYISEIDGLETVEEFLAYGNNEAYYKGGVFSHIGYGREHESEYESEYE